MLFLGVSRGENVHKNLIIFVVILICYLVYWKTHVVKEDPKPKGVQSTDDDKQTVPDEELSFETKMEKIVSRNYFIQMKVLNDDSLHAIRSHPEFFVPRLLSMKDEKDRFNRISNCIPFLLSEAGEKSPERFLKPLRSDDVTLVSCFLQLILRRIESSDTETRLSFSKVEEEQFIELLDAEDNDIRDWAISIVGNLSLKSAIPKLESLLTSDKRYAWQNSSFWLAKINPSLSTLNKTVAALKCEKIDERMGENIALYLDSPSLDVREKATDYLCSHFEFIYNPHLDNTLEEYGEKMNFSQSTCVAILEKGVGKSLRGFAESISSVSKDDYLKSCAARYLREH